MIPEVYSSYVFAMPVFLSKHGKRIINLISLKAANNFLSIFFWEMAVITNEDSAD
jgi:hypothetical protein